MEYGISREEEAALPQFKSHTEARAYFKEIYGNDFQMVDSGDIDGEKIYFYKLILNKEAFWSFNKAMLEDMQKAMENVTEAQMYSSQDIQIFENGHIHICH